MDSQRRQLVAYILVGIALLAGVAAAAHIAGTVQTSGAVSLQAPDGMNVTVDGATDQLLEEPFPTSSQVSIVTEDGNATFTASGPANATIHPSEIEGTWTNVSAVDADANTITIDPDDKDSAVVGKATTSFSYTGSQTLDDSDVDFVYSASANGRVTVQGVPANTRIAAVDQDSGQLLDEATSGGSGVLTLDTLDSGTHDVTLQSFTPDAPTLSNASPTGPQSSEPNQLSVDVNDADFPSGDSVTVTFYVDGSQVSSSTITSNGTVTATMPSGGKTGGSHTWSANASDSYGEDTNQSFSYSVPSALQFREESPDHPLIETQGTTDPIVVEAVFYEDVESSPTIINRTTTDGTLDLDGLPVSSEFSVQVDAPGYHNRTVRLEDIYTQSDIFLISKDGPDTVQNRFVVSDRTGNFPPDNTEISIQAAVNESLYNSGGFSWMTVAGDDLGADEAFTTDLVDEKRYRIVVENNDGDERILGAYTAETTGTINLNIGSVVIDPEAGDTVGVNASWSNNTAAHPTVNVQYNDTASNTNEIHLHIYEYNNESNELLANTTFTGPYGTFSTTETVGPAYDNQTTWVVELTGVRSGGDNVEFQRIVGPNAPVLANMAPWLVSIIFVGIIWTTAGLFSQLNGDIGAVVVAGLGGILFFVDLVPGYLGVGVVVLSFIAAGLLFIRERNAGGL